MGLAWLHCFTLAALVRSQLAVVRAFASDSEVEQLVQNFAHWNTVLPCYDPPAAIDLILVYSRSFEENPAARLATEQVRQSFESKVPWSSCFRAFQSHNANLTAEEDVYDMRGYSARNDWANGPNRVFSFVTRSFYDGTFGSYDAFYFMELDAVPVRGNWLQQLVEEAYDDSMAVRGSRYRGDTWDAYLRLLPLELLFHVNGNAIYNLSHPWMQNLTESLQEQLSVAFDLHMARRTLEVYGLSDLGPYKGDSLLIGNYAQTLLNDSFEVPEFIRHGSAANIFRNVNESQITLGIFNHSDTSRVLQSLSGSHPFRRVVLVGEGPQQELTVDTPRGPTEVEPLTLQGHWVTAGCEVAEAANTRYVAFMGSESILRGPVYVLVDDAGAPVLPYIPADSAYCTGLATCTSEVEEAEKLFGVKLNYHHDTFETVFETAQFLRFCSAWRLAVSDLPSYEDCGVVNGVTADSFVAWLISLTDSSERFNFVPKNKERLGSRTWGLLATPVAPDPRNCSVYTEVERSAMERNLSHCALSDEVSCSQNCSWRRIFAAGRCVASVESFDFLWSPSYTITWTSTTASSSTTATATSVTGTTTSQTSSTVSLTSTSRTGTSSSLTSSTTMSSSISVTSTSSSVSSTGTSTTASSSSSTVTMTSSTDTTVTISSTSATFTALVECTDGLPLGYETSSCQNLLSGSKCIVECLPPLIGSSEYSCSWDGIFQGLVPTCAERFCTFSAPLDSFYMSTCDSILAGGFCLVSCPEGYESEETIYFCGPDWQLRGILPQCRRILCDAGTLPIVAGANYSDCSRQISPGQTCQVTCLFGFEGPAQTMSCQQSGAFLGQTTSCVPKPCSLSLNASVEVNCRTGVMNADVLASHGDLCAASCAFGFFGPASELRCVNGVFEGVVPECQPVQCTWQGFSLRSHVDNSDCNAKKLGEDCLLSCKSGYDASGDPRVRCQSDNFFSEPFLSCSPSACGDLSTGFDPTIVGHTCQGARFADTCSSFCLDGYQLVGNATEYICSAVNTNAGFTQLDGLPLVPPTCAPKPCTDGFPTMRGAAHNCSGVTTGAVCIVTAQEGYQATPAQSVLRCLSDGRVNGTMPTVEPARCQDASFGVGVGSTCQNKVVGSECWAYCAQGYLGDPARYFCVGTAQGTEVVADVLNISCTENVTAGRRLQSACDGVAVQSLGLERMEFVHSCASLPHDEVCLVHCDLGWQMTSSPSVLVCDQGNLQGVLPTCQPLPCSFSLPGAETVHNCSGARTNEHCVVGCGAGFQGTSVTKTCHSSGNFLGADPICEALTCPSPSMAAQYSHDCVGRRFGESCTVQCSDGYQGGLARVTCGSSGSFEGGLPVCQPVSCVNTVPLDPAFERSSCDGLTFGQTCSVSCNVGYFQNVTTVSCSSQGALVGVLPLCRPFTCDRSHLQRVEFLDNCGNISYGRNCSVFCAIGFEALNGLGLEEHSCGMSAGAPQLLGALPSCVASKCVGGLPLASERSSDNCSGLSFQETCLERCDEGYAGGSSSFTCNADRLAQRLGATDCQPEQCDSAVVPALLQHTCVNVSFQGSCYAYCPPGYVGEQMATRLQCLGSSSTLPSIGTQDVTLRGQLPDCAPARCTFNIPWEAQYLHNCSAAVTGQHCLVSCADGWFGSVEAFQCQATGDLSGVYPNCQTTTATTTRTVTSTDGTELILATGTYLVQWPDRNTTQEESAVLVEQTLSEYLNVTEHLVDLTILVLANMTEELVEFNWELQLRTSNATKTLDSLYQLMASREHAFLVQAALQSLGGTPRVLRFFGDLGRTVSFSLTSFGGGEVLEPTDVVSLLLPGVLLGLCVVGCFGCSVQRVRRRRRARQGAGGESEEAAKEEAAVQIIPSAMEVQEPLALEDKVKEAKMKLSDDERRQLDELGISFDDDEEVFLSGDERDDLAALGIHFEGAIGGSCDEQDTASEASAGTRGRTQLLQTLEDAGLAFEEESFLSEEPLSHGLFESDDEPLQVSVVPMDTGAQPPRIANQVSDRALLDAGIVLEENSRSDDFGFTTCLEVVVLSPSEAL